MTTVELREKEPILETRKVGQSYKEIEHFDLDPYTHIEDSEPIWG